MSYFIYPEYFDVIVVGAGHAGIEAALISARMAAKTLLITQNLDTIGQMSCNPSIGGTGKGQIVKEIDALGGYMGINADNSSINYHTLNTSRGPAVHAPRAQCDKKLYHMLAKQHIEKALNLFLMQDEVASLYLKGSKLCGIITRRNTVYQSKTVILTTGTFLNGVVYVGEFSSKGGRYNDPPSTMLSGELKKSGFNILRLKTGTPMRLNKRGIRFDLCTEQKSDAPAKPFSIFTDENELNRKKFMPCWITRTNEKTFEIISKNLNRSALYSGRIKSIGPRYCPSIEDKIFKFPHHPSHHIFLEPEGFKTNEYYVNGLSTSLSEDVQREIIKSIPALENSSIIRPGYAIEYDLIDPKDLNFNLESKIMENLFTAGQINGTTGYEEAAAQGLMAGINAVLKIRGKEPFIIRRDEGYIGVMIEDLITRGVDEPYRMFTSRAEYRIFLRQDNADLRLSDYAFKLGIFDMSLKERFEKYKETYNSFLSGVNSKKFNEDEMLPWKVENARIAAENQKLYSVYIERYKNEIEKMKKFESIRIPKNFDYNDINELSIETRQKLSKIRPENLSEAYHIPGITVADVQLVWVLIEKMRYERNRRSN
ncbi:MAG: tRNA uridine-5-carboxymethylaminomethyl(34) synthesis enzyme MnmG [Elusimicrobiales bacterium]|nr:tRNA uridine-5-carboxymethylaminomethyl(34) synthesis enzyme MnmG [Elusimicrobiales bacterium]